jgi:hypothetical protein
VIERFNRLRFDLAAARIRTTEPARLAGSALTVVSMVNHRDVDAYLVALKSFCNFAEVARVILVADPTLTEEDKAVLRDHVPEISFRAFESCAEPGLPRGGCWERIVCISDLVSESYVIQLDADTVTISDVPEVTDCVQSGRAFSLASAAEVRIVSVAVAAAAARARLTPNDHIQTVSEANLDVLGSDWHYARACAAFAGFPKGSFSRSTLKQLSDAMGSRVGPRWSDWGSEQVTSNIISASQPDSALLPHPKYCNANHRGESTVFMHFIGYARFTNDAYRQAAQNAIDAQRHSTR